jgi:amidohydrolase
MTDILRGAGFTVEAPFCKMPTAFNATLSTGGKPRAALLAEYDALPGIGHACGHNLHGSLTILAALALAEVRDAFSGTLSVIGTPDEEVGGGKVDMADAGVFDGLDIAAMMHSTGGGFSTADMDVLSLRCCLVTFTGKSAHAAAAPWEAHSALAAARMFLSLIDARRECFTPDIRANAIFVEGGKACNIIPDRAVVRIEFRTDAMGKMAKLDDTIKKCAKGAALALDCKTSFKQVIGDFADMVRVPLLEGETEKILASLGAKVAPVAAPCGSSDVGNTSYRCPTIQPLIAITDEPYALHTTELADATLAPAAKKALAVGAETLARLLYRVLADEKFRKAVHDDWDKQRTEKLI